MAKRKAARRAKSNRSRAKRAATRRSGKRPSRMKAKAVRPAKRRAAARPRRTAKRRPAPSGAAPGARAKTPRLDRQRRTLEEIVPTPPLSLDMDRRGSAARTGRAELVHSLQEHHGITPALTAGDVDANWEQAYFSGDEAPGGDNPT